MCFTITGLTGATCVSFYQFHSHLLKICPVFSTVDECRMYGVHDCGTCINIVSTAPLLDGAAIFETPWFFANAQWDYRTLLTRGTSPLNFTMGFYPCVTRRQQWQRIPFIRKTFLCYALWDKDFMPKYILTRVVQRTSLRSAWSVNVSSSVDVVSYCRPFVSLFEMSKRTSFADTL